MTDFSLSFLPLFVAIDALGILPVFLSFSQDLKESEKKTLVTQATWTAVGISVLFLFSGKFIFATLGINENDFRIAGGIILFMTAIRDLTSARGLAQRTPDDSYIGIVPLGIPLIMGPAALTTILISVDSYGYLPTVLSLLANLLIVWALFRKAELLTKLIGVPGAKAFGKVMALFLAAIAIMMVRQGVFGILHLKP